MGPTATPSPFLVAYVERCGEAGVDDAEVSQFSAKATSGDCGKLLQTAYTLGRRRVSRPHRLITSAAWTQGIGSSP
jgi:hypothetical protein